MKILVTGGSGLVGYGIQSIYKDYDHEFIFISSKDYDLLDLVQVQKLFEKEQPDLVIHLAACVGGLFKNMNCKVDMYEKNIMINYNVLHLFSFKTPILYYLYYYINIKLLIFV
jgi:GDP-L-fucose synthase